MYITDFTYDNISLSSLGYVVCGFNTSSQEEISNGSNIEFTKVATDGGRYYALANSIYPECLTTTFSICKNYCASNYDPRMTVAEISRIASWLNRKDFHKLTVDADGYENIFFEGSFPTIQRVEFGGDVIGLTLQFVTNKPFANSTKKTTTLTFNAAGSQTLNVYSDELTDFYPEKVTITPTAAGNITVNGCTIKNCGAGEIITLEYPTISSSNTSHSLANDFNYNFIKLTKNTVGDYQANTITASAACTVKFEYYPVVKISL